MIQNNTGNENFDLMKYWEGLVARDDAAFAVKRDEIIERINQLEKRLSSTDKANLYSYITRMKGWVNKYCTLVPSYECFLREWERKVNRK